MAELTPHATTFAKPTEKLQCIPIRAATTSGRPDDTERKEGLLHTVHYFSAVANTNTYDFGMPVRSAAFAPSSATTVRPDWDPDDADGTITFAASGASTGWLHVWRYPGSTSPTKSAATATIGTPHANLNGDPFRVLPRRTTASQGLPESVMFGKEHLKHTILYFGAFSSGDYYNAGRTVVSAVFSPFSATTTSTSWTPGSSTGKVVITASGATAGWLHLWTAD